MTDSRITATFVVDTSGRLRLADRHSEHVACAGGAPVLAAGEVALCIHEGCVAVEAVSNQSTGYCPEPESWPALASVLSNLNIEAPTGYTTVLVFRRCPRCGQINVIKDCLFECAVCGSLLPAFWNLDAQTAVT